MIIFNVPINGNILIHDVHMLKMPCKFRALNVYVSREGRSQNNDFSFYLKKLKKKKKQKINPNESKTGKK